jgi:hypothetical protein
MKAHYNKTRRLHVLIPGEYSRPQSLSESNLASIRMRSGLAASFLGAAGWKVSVGEIVSGDPDVILVGKIGAHDIAQRTPDWIRKLQEAKGKRCKVLVDYTDNHLGFDSPMSPFYSSATELADHFVAPGIFLAQQLANRSEKPIALIPDPIEVPVIPVKSGKPNSPTRALWFGHRTNISYLVDFIEKQLTNEYTLEILVLSDEFALSALRNHQYRTAARVTLNLAPWSLKNLISASQIADICIIPSDPNDPKKAGASSNRLVTALALGLPTAVDLLPSSIDFSDFVVEIQSQKFSELLRNPEIMNDKTTVAQQEVVPNFSPMTIGQQWVGLINSIIK